MAMARGGQVVAPPTAGQLIAITGDANMMLVVMAAALVVSVIFAFSSELAARYALHAVPIRRQISP
jgi:hypothetical protein